MLPRRRHNKLAVDMAYMASMFLTMATNTNIFDDIVEMMLAE